MGKLKDLWRQAWIASALAVLLLAGSPVQAAPAVSESALKAALLLKLGRYTYFPGEEQPQQQVICVLGQTRLQAELEKLVAALPDADAVRLVYPASAADITGCQLVCVAQSEQRRLSGLLRELDGVAALTLSDMHGFAQRGGMVEMQLDSHNRGQIKLRISRQNAARQGIKFNAQLLRLATLVD